jgi:hypothetical protein
MFYKLNVGGYSGDAGDALSQQSWSPFISNGMKFTTSDADHDNCPAETVPCVGNAGGWWFNWCSVKLSEHRFDRDMGHQRINVLTSDPVG